MQLVSPVTPVFKEGFRICFWDVTCMRIYMIERYLDLLRTVLIAVINYVALFLLLSHLLSPSVCSHEYKYIQNSDTIRYQRTVFLIRDLCFSQDRSVWCCGGWFLAPPPSFRGAAVVVQAGRGHTWETEFHTCFVFILLARFVVI